MLVKIKLNAMHEQIPAHASIGDKTSQKWNEFLFIFYLIKMKKMEILDKRWNFDFNFIFIVCLF